ncbi:MAG: class I SAM-dependent methyltransferase, partial [Pseudomonadota bacterium]
MYEDLKSLSARPSVFSVYTADVLWTDPHLGKKMLETHLSQETTLASRTKEPIDRVVNWIDETFGLDGQSVCDLGCGPGLYSNAFAARGAVVRGLDFSQNSIAYARDHAPSGSGAATYLVANYLSDPLPKEQNLITLIYCDLCALSAAQRDGLLVKIRQSLAPGGKFVFDVYSKAAFEAVRDNVVYSRGLMNGFW